MNDKPFAAATERNSQPILDVVREEFRHSGSILEIGSGTGQHAVCFGSELGNVIWQTSDVAENHAGIRAWLAEAALPNVRGPIVLDVLTDGAPSGTYHGVFSANTAHIMSFAVVEKMFLLVASVLAEDGIFVLYGPFRQGGEFNTQSNAEFHESLRQRDSAMGIRHLEDLDRLAAAGGMDRVRFYAMPANNHIAVWIKRGTRQVR